MKMNMNIWLAIGGIYLLVVWGVLLICIYSLATGSVSFALSGFGVDTAGVLYVGKEKKLKNTMTIN